MLRKRLALALLLLNVAGCSLRSPAPRDNETAAGVPAGWLRPCWLPGVGRQAFCGSYEVFEDRAARRGRRIPLAVVFLPARSATPAPDPVFYLDGGPGNAATEAAAEIAQLLGPVLEDRALVLVDQRGTGGSNPLSCDLAGPQRRPLPETEADLFGLARVRACRDQLAARADLTLYTTPIAMADLDEVRAALGFERINLLGASYGTSAAQVYMRQYPDRVRSVVFVAPGPIDLRYPLFAARDVERALDLLFADCAADPACAAAFPRLREDFAAVVARLERGPVRAEVPDPQTRRPETVVLTLDLLRLTLPYRLYSTEAAARVPLAIHQAAQGDFTAMARASRSIWRQTWAAPSQGLYLSVSCSEDAALLDPHLAPSPPPPARPEPDALVEEVTRGTFVGDLRVRLHRARCGAWPRATLPAGYWDPVRSDIPALLLAGEVDPILPPVWAEEVARYLPNGRLVVVPQASHWPITPCTSNLVRELIATGSAAGLDTACVQTTRRPPFVLR